MKLAIALIVLSGTASASTDVLTQQFDIECRQVLASSGKSPATVAPDFRQRIDLGAGEFCIDNCGLVKKLAAVTDEYIFFQRRDQQTPDDTLSFIRLNRASGKYEARLSSPALKMSMNVTASCEVTDFSGFPAHAVRNPE